MEQIKKKHFYSKQIGRALLILVTDKEIYKINIKRKREYTEYEPTFNKSNEYKSKWLKPQNYDYIRLHSYTSNASAWSSPSSIFN